MTRAMKRTFIAISSSSSSSSDEEMSSQESEEPDSSDGDGVKEISFSTCHEEDNEDVGNEENERKDEESCCRRVIQLLREDSDIQVLTLMECKAYLRRHGLRLSGSRAECIQRIKEHWRLKDGNGEVLYPRSTFSINCTGDVCRGDVVLFHQKVYKKFNKASRSGHLSGKRWVAGRVIKESYGAAKQQHTFTVEVLWSTGLNKLPALSPLLIKGRNLYRMKTFRQQWKDENQRAKVLEEKHKRGDAARSIREKRWAKSALRKQSTASNSKGRKRRKKVEHSQPSQNVKPFVEGGKQAEECKNPAEQKKICKPKVTLPITSEKVALPITSDMPFVVGGKQAEERKNPAEQKKICKQKVALSITSEKVAMPITSDMPFVEGGKQAEKCKNLAKKKKICKHKVTVPRTSEKVARPITSDMPLVEGGKQAEERKNLAEQKKILKQKVAVPRIVEGGKQAEERKNPSEQKKICKQKVALPITSEKIALPITSDMPFVVGGKQAEKGKNPAKKKKICKQKVVLPITSEKVILPITSLKVILPITSEKAALPITSDMPFAEGGKQAEERNNPAKHKKICKLEVTLPITSEKVTLPLPITSDMKKTRVLSAHTSHPIPRYTYTAHPFEVRPSSSQPLAFPRYPTHFPLGQNHHPFEVGPSSSQPLAFPTYPTHFPLGQKHHPFEVRPSSSQPLAFPTYPTHLPLGQNHHPFEVRPPSSQPLAFPRHPTHLPLEQNHNNAPNFFSSSGPFFNSGFPNLRPPPASVDLGFVNVDNRRYHAHPSQETGWINPGSYYGPATYPERRRYHPY